MTRRTFTESAFDRLPLSILEMSETEHPQAVILFIHGLCGRKERNIDVMKYMTDKGFACVSYDLRGHGDSILSEEDRGYTNQGGAKAMATDIESVVEKVKEDFKDAPIYIVAHSMGSLAARTYLKDHDTAIKGMVICGSPSRNIFNILGRSIMWLISLVNDGRVKIGGFQEATSGFYNKAFRKEGRMAWTCSDPHVRERFRNDKKCNITITADCSLTLLQMMKETYSRKGWHTANPSLPVLFISGTEDPCMIDIPHFHRSAGFLNKVGYTNVSSILFPEMRHEVLNEKGREMVWDEILHFVERQQAKA